MKCYDLHLEYVNKPRFRLFFKSALYSCPWFKSRMTFKEVDHFVVAMVAVWYACCYKV